MASNNRTLLCISRAIVEFVLSFIIQFVRTPTIVAVPERTGVRVFSTAFDGAVRVAWGCGVRALVCVWHGARDRVETACVR